MRLGRDMAFRSVAGATCANPAVYAATCYRADLMFVGQAGAGAGSYRVTT